MIKVLMDDSIEKKINFSVVHGNRTGGADIKKGQAELLALGHIFLLSHRGAYTHHRFSHLTLQQSVLMNYKIKVEGTMISVQLQSDI